MNSYTVSNTQTFTLTHAKYLASKVATDLKRMQRFYGYPSDTNIARYEEELIELLKNGYLSEVTYGFKRGDKWIEPCLRYNSVDLSGMYTTDDDPGKVVPGADINGASFYSYLVKTSAYYNLSSSERENFEQTLPFQRTSASAPGIDGYMTSDKTYSSGGKSLNRSILKSN
ncbi:HORMA-1 domain-containing protein [Chryseobacterium indologenes]|uniref:HORMA-1 domain-containing protein n=1 Tax=Chryseobacterium indologenes TaxID=253 RepID=UPI0016278AF0|nr:hypothetical protein [Chryseobacterium indologenes]